MESIDAFQEALNDAFREQCEEVDKYFGLLIEVVELQFHGKEEQVKAFKSVLEQGNKAAIVDARDGFQSQMNLYNALDRIKATTHNDVLTTRERCKSIDELCEKLAANVFWNVTADDDSGEPPFSDEELEIKL